MKSAETRPARIGWSLLLAAGYGIALIALRNLSDDQWYLPAGLRLALLLLLPYRFWWGVLLGEASALLYLRLPHADHFGLQWVLVSSLTYTAWVFPLVRWAREDIARKPEHAIQILLVVTAMVSLLGTGLYGLLIWILSKSQESIDSLTYVKLARFALGDYLGILMFAPLALLWKLWRAGEMTPEGLWRSAFGVLLMNIVIAAAVNWLPIHDYEMRQAFRLIMIMPAALLTFQHGWHGAAIGVVMSNLGIGLTIASSGKINNHDDSAFLVQEVLAISATVLLLLGAGITRHYRKAIKNRLSEAEAWASARQAFSSSERALREKVLRLAEFHSGAETLRHAILRDLRRQGVSHEALDVLSTEVTHSRLLDEFVKTLYPIELERDGLYNSLYQSVQTEAWSKGPEIVFSLRGHPQRLSIDLQLAAYRCVYDAITILSNDNPKRIHIRTRCSRGLRRRKLLIRVTASGSDLNAEHVRHSTAVDDLINRVRIHGGVYQRRPYRICILLSEPSDAGYSVDLRTSQAVPPVASV